MCYSITVERDLDKLSEMLQAHVDQHSFDNHKSKCLINPKKFKSIEDNPRIFPNYWAPILIASGSENLIKPMRYRVRPQGSKDEVPAKYNLFNCRLDALEKRQTWKQIFMKNHGILVFKEFYEWVACKETGKKIVLGFSPRDQDYVLCPVLWDMCYVDGELLFSFAVVTTDPNPEVLAQGHDRSPVFLRQDYLDIWLNPGLHGRQSIDKALSELQPVYYNYALAA